MPPASKSELRFTRSGGFGGIVLRATIDAAGLSESEAAEIRALAAKQSGTAPKEGRPDRFQYDLVLAEGGAEQRATLAEPDVPEALAPLLRRLTGEAQP